MKYNVKLTSTIVIVLVLALLVYYAYYYARASPYIIKPDLAKKLLKMNKIDLVLDVRTDLERNTLGFYPGSVHIQSSDLEKQMPLQFPDKNIKFPLTPDQIDNGAPHPSNHGYSYAKRLSGYQTNIIKKVLNSNWVSVIPTNVYGTNDNFHLEDGHMIPAMIHRAYLSKQRSEKMVVWGDGSPLRQVIYSEDLAKLIIWSLNNWTSDDPFMAINPIEDSILDIAKIICNTFDIKDNDIIFDPTKPMGQHKKPAITNAPVGFELKN